MRTIICNLCGEPVHKKWNNTKGHKIHKRYYKTKIIWDTGTRETLNYCKDCMDAFKEYAYLSIRKA